MAFCLDCERVLATVDWADGVLVENGLETGYAVDARLLGPGQIPRVTGEQESVLKPPPGKFARYQRGDCYPSMRVIAQLDTTSGLAIGRLHHPLYTVLRVGSAGRDSWQSRDLLEGALGDTERRLAVRLSRYVDLGWTFERRPMTPRMMLTLAASGTSYALTALLCGAMERAEYGEDPRPAIERALQCLVLAVSRGEFRLTWPVIAARVRQQVLDTITLDGRVADTAPINLTAAVVEARAVLKEASNARCTPKQCTQRVRAWLSGSEAAMLKPRFVHPDEALASRRLHPVALKMLPIPRGQFAHVRDYGRRAREVLARALADYVREDGEPPIV